ncbi:hypothetical protein V498_10126 [Pseudogymnoascus sp. VKM F-4517 (FW-2822)]|nr:hypothetical protein V498_10126 [Pseudogymnoascus sp. VKM F-4517 (FW-2822)]
MHVIPQHNLPLHILQRQEPPIPRLHALHQRPAQARHAPGLPLQDVRAVVAQDGVRGLREQGAQRELVAHCAGEDEEGGGVAGEGGEARFEGERGGVGAEDVVEVGCAADGVQHGGGGGGDDVGAEVGGGGVGGAPGGFGRGGGEEFGGC